MRYSKLRGTKRWVLSATFLLACSAEDPTGAPPSGSSISGTASGGRGNASGGNATSSGGASSGGSVNPGASGGSTGSGSDEPAGLLGITADHNLVRTAANPTPSITLAPLTWDPGLAATAQAWADACIYTHSMGSYGENLYARAGNGSTSPSDVVSSWAKEGANYNYADNSCADGKVCGHYTQIVWGNTKRVGCGMKKCSENSPFQGFPDPNWELWVCNYDPPGNFNQQKPY